MLIISSLLSKIRSLTDMNSMLIYVHERVCGACDAIVYFRDAKFAVISSSAHGDEILCSDLFSVLRERDIRCFAGLLWIFNFGSN